MHPLRRHIGLPDFPKPSRQGYQVSRGQHVGCRLPARGRQETGGVAPPRTFGFHTFRRTLASVLVKMKVDPKLVQEMVVGRGRD